ncbi:sodium:alanine symporter family protein [Methylophilaceae bacterium]|nr:sodium:alanine symporter family protein [Methylophilaceae bacterium]MDC1173543.1 sodium:alanine symporter family protein [Methylophilaceae bacterium]
MQLLEKFESFIGVLSGWVWGPPMLILLFGTHIYLTFLLRGLQFRSLPLAFKIIFTKDNGKGDISQFSSLMTALAATVGIGNIVGVATAITLGGPGAIFWMWLTGLLGMATKYSEGLLAVKYREKGPSGMRGGAMYYISKGANMPLLGAFFAFFTVVSAFGVGNMVQANSSAHIFESAFNISTHWTGIFLAILTGLVIIGGIKSIGRFVSVLVPFMIILYIGTMLVTLSLRFDQIPHAFSLIFNSAFNGASATGGFVGATIATAIRFGVARGLFSNEAGLGSASIVAASAKTKDPVSQALVTMTGTFIDTIVVCTLTALVILTTDVWTLGISAGELTSKSVEATLGYGGVIIIAFSTALFAFSTLIGWSYYGEKGLEFLMGTNIIKYYRIAYVFAVFIGSTMSLGLIWNLSDITNGMMAIPNLIGLLLLSKIIKSETNKYFIKR